MKKYGWDALALISISTIGYGVYMIHLPSALIVVGGLLLLTALIGARAKRLK